MPPVPVAGSLVEFEDGETTEKHLALFGVPGCFRVPLRTRREGLFGEYMKKQNETKNTAQTMVALFHVPARVALALQHGDGNLADWCAELLGAGWETDMESAESAKWAAAVRKKFGCTEEDGESIVGLCVGFVEGGGNEENAICAALVPPVEERNKQMEVTGEAVARELCRDVLGRASFADDPAVPSAGDLYAIHQAKHARSNFGDALVSLADVAASLVGHVPDETPEGARFVAATRAFIDAARWFSHEQHEISSAVGGVIYEGMNNAAAAAAE